MDLHDGVDSGWRDIQLVEKREGLERGWFLVWRLVNDDGVD